MSLRNYAQDEHRLGRRTGGTLRSRVLAASLLLLTPIFALADIEVKGVEYVAETTDSGVVRIDLTGPAPKPRSFTIDNPARLAIDLPQVKLGNAKRRFDVDAGMTRSVQIAEAGNRSRVVINLLQMVPFDVRTDANSVYVAVNVSAGGKETTPFTASASVEAREAQKLETSGLRKIDFRRDESGGGQIRVELGSPSTVIDLQEKGGKIVANFLDARLPQNLERRLDVTDFATPVNSVDAYNTQKGSRIEINTKGEIEHLAYQTDNIFIVNVNPVSKEEKLKEMKEKFGYTGEKLSLNFQNIEVRAVLQLLADFTGLNLVASDSVGGNITLRLKNVPWDQALDIILKTQGLAQRQKGNVLLVAPQDELAAQEKKELEARQQIEELAPLRTEFVEVNYAKASEVAALLKQEANSLMSSRGSVTVDERTNTLMVLDTEEKLAEIRQLVKRLDVPVKQVMIESRIVIASDDFSRNLGVRWGSTSVGGTANGGVVGTSGTVAGTDTIANSSIDNINTTGSAFPVTMPAVDDRLNVNLPSIGTGGTIAFAILSSDYLVDLELSALQTEGRGEVVSNPRVITSNQMTARIEQGVEVPYQQASASGATNVAFKKAVLSLEVTPQITPDERVTMDLSVSKDSVGSVVNGIPTINTRAVNTRVLINNGDTVVLGGIYEETTTNSIDKVPLLGDIPFLGYFFRRTQKVNSKAELLIFVTPKILKDGVVAAAQ